MKISKEEGIALQDEVTPFNELLSLCKIEEIGLKAKISVGPSEQV